MNATGGPAIAPPQPGAAGQPSLTDLVSGIVSDAQTLLKQQFTMLRAEVKEDLSRTQNVVLYLGAGAVLAALGAVFLLTAAVYLLHELTAPAVPLWACWAIVGGVLAAAGVVALVVGKRTLDSYNPLPDKTLNAATENVSWIASPNPQT